jgi:hypothetical protein
MGKHKKHQVIGIGPPCPRCRQRTEVRAHTEITAKHLAQPFYYERWFYCNNRACRTTLIMPEEARVYRDEATRARFERYSSVPSRFEDVLLEVLDEGSGKAPWEE